MSVSAMITHLLLERLSKQVLPRIPEPMAIMTARDQIAAFTQGGRDGGILAHIYFFHAVMSLPIIKPGDTVLDLACGPANQLVHTARLNPEAKFIGIDASPAMLEHAGMTLADQRIENATLQPGDITDLHTIDSASVDAINCTMSLHHLPDTAKLLKAAQEIRRVLKPGGGIYLADFGRLKRTATQHYFARDRTELQSPAFTEDFLNSMRAAFGVDELKMAFETAALPLALHQTALAPFMMLARSTARRAISESTTKNIRLNYANLTAVQRRDFDNMARWFRWGGLACHW